MKSNATKIWEAIGTKGFAHGAAVDFVEATGSEPWRRFARSWDDLPLDGYMGDGGRYRQRRYAEFRCSGRDQTIVDLPSTTYRQSRSVNYLNGGIDRTYSGMDSETKANGAFRAILERSIEVLRAGGLQRDWLVQVFQNRILARADETGKPTPEGLHRDGVDFVLTLLVNRKNVEGGESSTHCGLSEQVLSRVLLHRPGDFIFLDDNRVKHAVQPIFPAHGSVEGRRDVLVAMFTAA